MKYMYNGIPLVNYCLDNNINIATMRTRIHRIKIKNPNLTDDEVIKLALSKCVFKKFSYNGISLRQYCIKNSLVYKSIQDYINRKLKNNPDIDITDLVEEAIRETKNKTKYYYNGIPLVKYAEENNLSYDSLIKYINKKFKKDNTINMDDLIEEAINTISHRNIKRYVYNGESLKNYCRRNGYSYYSIYDKIKELEKDNTLSNEEIIEKAIKYYEEKLKRILEINNIKHAFDRLNTENINEIKEICMVLKISYDNVCELVSMNLSYKQAIKIIWFFADKDIPSYKAITYCKVREILTLINDIKNNNKDISKIDLYDLIGIYRCDLYDSRNEILIRQRKHIFKVLYSNCNLYNIKLNSFNLLEFENEIKFILLSIIDSICLNNEGQIIKYIDLIMNKRFKGYLVEYKKNQQTFSLDTARYAKDKGTKKEKKIIDYIPSTNTVCQIQESTFFSEDFMDVLSTLSSDDLLFVTLKYQDNYDNQYLANFFDLTIEEIKEKESKILSSLRSNDKINVLYKRKKKN